MIRNILRTLAFCFAFALISTSYVYAQTSSLGNTPSFPTTGDTSVTKCIVLTKYLFSGMTDAKSGGEVSVLQGFLTEKGFLSISTKDFGNYGRNTRIAVSNFQKANNINPSGNVGEVTRALIKKITCEGGAGTTAVAVRDNKLKLSYDASQKEVLLEATARIIITPSGVIRLDKNSSLIGSLFLENGGAGTFSEAIVSTRGVTTAAKLTIEKDQYAREFYVIPAGMTVEFSVKTTYNPKQLFGGSYHMSYEYIYSWNAQHSDYTKIAIDPSKSDSVVVVGETSPYITGIPNPTKIGEPVKVSGVRLSPATVFLDGAQVSSPVAVNAAGTEISFALPANITIGMHTVQLENTSGKSNYFSFGVAAGDIVCVAAPCVPANAPQFAFVAASASIQSDPARPASPTALTANFVFKVKPTGASIVALTANNIEMLLSTKESIVVKSKTLFITPNDTTLAQGGEYTVYVSGVVWGTEIPASGSYYFSINKINWTALGMSPVSKIDGLGDWKTNSVTFTKGDSQTLKPTVTSVLPDGGLVGAQVTLTGTGFTPTNNTIRFGTGYILGLTSTDGKTIRLTVPEYLSPCLPNPAVACLAAVYVVDAGKYTIAVTNANGTSNEVAFNVRVATTPTPTPIYTTPKVVSFTIFSAETNKEYAVVNGETTIDLSKVGKYVGIRVNTEPATVASVKVKAEGPTPLAERIEKNKPYTLVESTNTDDYPNTWAPKIGVYTFVATPYSDAGVAGTVLRVKVNITNSAPQAVNIPPRYITPFAFNESKSTSLTASVNTAIDRVLTLVADTLSLNNWPSPVEAQAVSTVTSESATNTVATQTRGYNSASVDDYSDFTLGEYATANVFDGIGGLMQGVSRDIGQVLGM